MTSIDHLRGGGHLAASRANQGKGNSVANGNDNIANQPNQNVRGDDVRLSQQSKIHQQLATEPAFDNEKVAAIKAAIANGSYQVNPERLAENIMKFEDELRHV